MNKKMYFSTGEFAKLAGVYAEPYTGTVFTAFPA